MSISGFVTRVEAGLRAPDSVSYNIAPERGGVGVHWGGTPQYIDGHQDCVEAWRDWQNYHMDKHGWSDIAYTMGFCDHGYVFAGRGKDVRTAANGTNDANGRYYAIVWIGGQGEQASERAIEAMWWAIDTLQDSGAGSDVRPHSDFKATSCCGDFLREVIEIGEQAPAPKPDPQPQPKPDPEPEPEDIVSQLPLVKRRTNLGTRRAEDARVQGLLAAAGFLSIKSNTDYYDGSTRFDGKFGPSTEDAVEKFQRDRGLSVDGIVGKNTWSALLGV